MAQEQRAYGLWESPITPESLAQRLRFSDVAWDDDGLTLVWLEGRSSRGVLVCAPADGSASYDLNTDLSARAKVGYGGGDFTVAGGEVFFVESSGRLYRLPLAAGEARPLTPAFGHAAAPVVSPDRRWVAFVHSYEGTDSLAVVDAEGKHWPQRLASGADFYMQPCWHPGGTRIAWVEWNHPLMPWDGTELHLAELDVSGTLPRVINEQVLAGGSEVAVFQPAFSPDGRWLAYVSDESGWGHVYLHDLSSGERRAITEGAFEVGAPAWVQGLRTIAFTPDSSGIYYLRNELGFRSLWRYDLASGESSAVPGLEEYSWFDSALSVSPVSGAIATVASSASIPHRVITLEPEKKARIVARSQGERVPAGDLSTPRPLTWPTAGGAVAHGLYYPPASSRFSGSGLPPAVLLIHGGPTSQAPAHFDANAQFFTSRGYAVLQVNYRGSTGYGRPYMLELRGTWGIADVEDVVSAARYLGEQGLADPDRLVMMGGSAGGYTILQTLVHHPGVFRASICSFGVSSLFSLASDTHKFEERYTDSLVGPLPEARAVYRERSPIFFADRIQDPIAVFQGEDDIVVPRDQSDTIVAVLRRRGVPHEYHVYEGEGHGWRKSETLKHFYTQIERFLRQHVIFV